MLKHAVLIGLTLTGQVLAQDVPLPRARPADLQAVALPKADDIGPGPTAIIAPTPPRDYQTACPAVLSGRVSAEVLPPIHEGQCGLQSPLALTALTVNGREVELSSIATTDCGMATALPEWLSEVDSYATAREKTRIETVLVSTSYECRNVNHAKGGDLSFHAFGDALDIMGFVLEDGRTVSIAPDWNGTVREGRDILHFARDAACGHFTTVLGPDADAFHQDNVHLDLACHGKACSVRLCQ